MALCSSWKGSALSLDRGHGVIRRLFGFHLPRRPSYKGEGLRNEEVFPLTRMVQRPPIHPTGKGLGPSGPFWLDTTSTGIVDREECDTVRAQGGGIAVPGRGSRHSLTRSGPYIVGCVGLLGAFGDLCLRHSERLLVV